MTEQQIKDGYERLEAGVAPPVDALVRVERRMATRRRRRRTAAAGASALGVLAVGGLAVAALSGDDPGRGAEVATDPSAGPVSTLVMTRSDGSTVAFPDVTVSCDPPVTDAGDPISEAAGRIWMYSPIRTTGSEAADDVDLEEPFVYFEGSLAKIERGETFTFPDEASPATDMLPMIMFAADPAGTVEGRANEASSQEMTAVGTVRVLEAACEPAPMLRLDVDLTLGSEVEGPPLGLAGVVE
jgi:hypothetical protein